MKNYLAILIILLFCGCQESTNTNHFAIQLEKKRVLKEVKKYFNIEPITITSFFAERSAGTKNDFYSEGDYWWPNPKYPDSSYIRKDGLSNPNNFVAHRRAMVMLSQISGALASAYLVTKDKKYIKDLINHLNAWFVNSDTKMNPNLLYAQAIKGRVTGRGIGIIDTIHLIEVAKAVEVVEASNMMSKEELMKIKHWFLDYSIWLTTHEYGVKERDHGNNHSTYWTMQVAAFAKLNDNEELLDFCRTFFKETLLPNQMAEDGGFPDELSRTKPYSYSRFNLDGFFGLAQIISTEKNNMFIYKTEDGKSLKLGLEFMYPYLKNKNDWPYKKDVTHWEDWPAKHTALLFGGLNFKNEDYINLWAKLPEPSSDKYELMRVTSIRYPLLWISEN
ncbi:alginate lyase [Polaribacter filamentus]|uniref:Alginate lyase n=1 Tax=Polaribacter filamentus TaxID=53483 RepID=A0A2S7L236_9FLAO|nr:alginate lyase family protein [Polaribacter filamentus]PQB08951.1 alginate lyase [Polaribacter filamentus]